MPEDDKAAAIPADVVDDLLTVVAAAILVANSDQPGWAARPVRGGLAAIAESVLISESAWRNGTPATERSKQVYGLAQKIVARIDAPETRELLQETPEYRRGP